MNERPAPVDVEVPEDIRRIWEEYGTPIVKIPDPVLRQVASPVAKPTSEIRDLVEGMKAAMRGAHGVGLAAPQMGVPLRLFIYQLPEENAPLRVVLNPRIVQAKGEQVGPEGCLSIPMLQGDVKRAFEISGAPRSLKRESSSTSTTTWRASSLPTGPSPRHCTGCCPTRRRKSRT
jgi:peptide deformylase